MQKGYKGKMVNNVHVLYAVNTGMTSYRSNVKLTTYLHTQWHFGGGI